MNEKEDSKRTGEWSTFLVLFLYALTVMLFCSGFSPLFDSNTWADVNVYFNIGKAMMNGQILYQDIFDHKGPLIFILYGIGAKIGSSSFAGVYLIQSILFFICLTSVYKTSRLYLNKLQSLLSTIIFSYFPLIYSAEGGSAEEFLLPFISVSFYLLLKYLKQGDEHNPRWMLIHGAMICSIFLIKFNLLGFYIFIPLIFLYRLLEKKYIEALKNLLALSLGLILVGAPVFLYFYFTNSIKDFYQVYIDFNVLYGSVQTNANLISRLVSRFLILLEFHPVYISPMFVGLGIFVFSRTFVRNLRLKIILPLTFIATYCVIFISSFILTYYYIPLSIFTSLGIIGILYFLFKKIRFTSMHPILNYILLVSMSIVVVGLNFLKKENMLVPSQAENLIESFAREIKKENKAEQTLVSLGLDYGVSIFTKANIEPRVKYFFTPNISKDIFPLIYNEQKKYIKEAQTNFVVTRNKYIDFAELQPYLDENYEIIKTYPMGEQVYYLYKRKS